MRVLLLGCVLLFLTFAQSIPSSRLICRDPDLGGQVPSTRNKQRKFLLIGGAGGGIGNYLIFYPSAFYFAALTGRDILISDDSIIGEMCEVINCGFPKYSEVAVAFPKLLGPIQFVRGAKVLDFHKHLSGERLIEDQVVRADGYKYMSGWYIHDANSTACIKRLTGCESGDVACHDRHALQRLVRGPFKAHVSTNEEKKIIGVPKNLKHAILTLPHSYAPRLDAAIHMRCQFRHFEQLVGPDDSTWGAAVKEMTDWLNSTSASAGLGLFRAIESKIVSEIPRIKRLAHDAEKSRRRLMTQFARVLNNVYGNDIAQVVRTNSLSRGKAVILGNSTKQHSEAKSTLVRKTNDNSPALRRLLGKHRDASHSAQAHLKSRLSPGTLSLLDGEAAQVDDVGDLEVFGGDSDSEEDGRVYVYLASDNGMVKDAFARYLVGHANISVMRVRNSGHIAHAKNLAYIRGVNNNTGVVDLVLDWYSLSLANIVFAWRRDTDILSTFTQSAQRVSGSMEKSDINAPIGQGMGTRGFYLTFKNGRTQWRHFY